MSYATLPHPKLFSYYMYTGFEYDKAGNVIRETRSLNTVSALSVPAGNLIWDALAFDASGRVTEKTDSFG